MFSFSVEKKLNQARLSTLTTPHGKIPGPFFQFVATRGAIRGMVFPEDLEKMGVDIVLANTYHLHHQPGEDIVQENGGLHGFMQWDKPITTDSGGYQVFSLGDHMKLDADGVTFKEPATGNTYRFTPEVVLDIEAALGADIIMPLDVCTSFSASRSDVEAALQQTLAWAKRSRDYYQEKGMATTQALYGIVQGGLEKDLRRQAAEAMAQLNFFGYSIGGELREGSEKLLAEVVAMTAPHMPTDKPRYLMGYGLPEDIIAAVRLGVDQFDCVLPIRNARHGQLFYDLNREELKACLQDPTKPIDIAKLYRVINITKSDFRRDLSVFSPGHPVMERPYTKAYVHHLLRCEAPSGLRLTVLHNIYFYVQLMQAIRDTIREYGTPISG
jgi:queuine tRNA-ribosyltransferase